MKTTRILFYAAFLVLAIATQSCQKNENLGEQNTTGILPARFKVEIPGSLTSDNSTLKSKLKSAKADTAKGNDIYRNLNTFIAVGEGAGDIIEKIIGAIVIYRIDRPMVISYESKDDHRVKNLVVKDSGNYAGKTYDYMLTITDASSESAADGGKAMQIFWNTSPIEGIAILKPYNIDRVENANSVDAAFRIEYSEVANAEYDSHMIVDIANLPMADPNTDPFAVKTLKMFVGKKGEFVDVYGNSNHPNAKFFTTKTGFDWAFVASGSKSNNIGVAEVGLPPSTLDNNTRSVLLGNYSIKNVLTEQINAWFYETFKLHPDANDLATYLKNADAPGFFNNNGFVQAGISPGPQYDPLVNRISSLVPYSPKAVDELLIDFK